MESLYIETSIISYLVARPSNNLITAARQKITYDQWDSELRLRIAKDIPILKITKECVELANLFFTKALLPEIARNDALHIAIATHYKMDFLLTWNCRHLANAHFIRKLQKISLEEGLEIPTICTPQEVTNEQM